MSLSALHHAGLLAVSSGGKLLAPEQAWLPRPWKAEARVARGVGVAGGEAVEAPTEAARAASRGGGRMSPAAAVRREAE
jgi:hypothetical protein